MPTPKEVINASGRLIGELRSGRTFSDLELADMLVSLNQMLGEWASELTFIHHVAQDEGVLTGAASYTMGPTGTLSGTRPVHILSAVTRTSYGATVPAKVVDVSEWDATVLDANETGLVADLVYPDYALPLITLRLWPNPASGALVIHSLKPLAKFAALTDTVALPEGYEEALVLNFAVRLAAEFDKQPLPEVLAGAERSRGAIRTANAHLQPPPPPVAAAPVAAPARA